MTTKAATEKWVGTFRPISTQLVARLLRHEPDWLTELAPATNDTDFLPIWGTMWSFGEWLDEHWLETEGLDIMRVCGFRVYQTDQDVPAYFFGIDGAGYDFYESHWVPLYLARGLDWHEKESREPTSSRKLRLL